MSFADEFDFHWLSPMLAVGGRFRMEQAAALARDHGIRAVVDVRSEDCDDEALLRASGIELLHLPTPDMEPVPRDLLDAGVSFVGDHIARREQVLIHCHHGIGRSALLALCVLVDQGRDPLDAILHAKNCREVISLSRAQYEGWAAWLRGRRIAPPDYHSFACIAYRHLAGG